MADTLHDRQDLRAALAESASRLIAAEAGSSDWRRMFAVMAEAGWLGLAVGEDRGGHGLGVGELAMLMRALGAANCRMPLGAVAGVGLPLLAQAAHEGLVRSLIASAIAGEALPVLAHQEAAAGYARGHVDAALTAEGDGWRLKAAKVAVEGGGVADHFLVSARLPDGSLTVIVAPATMQGVECGIYAGIDGRQLANISIDAVLPADNILALDDAAAAIDTALDRGALLAMAEAAGAMRTLFDDTLAYLNSRSQFGQPIGRFQVLQHRAVDMSIALEEAEAVVDAAADSAGTDGFARSVAVAKVVGGRSARLIAHESVQMHGGIGITEELRVSHYFRSLVAAENQYGDDDAYRARFAALAPARLTTITAKEQGA
ncbi:acyl-CoA dehydrogenase family protein [Bradyrhizobium sp. AS23.2]|uniref:acyl-CoA dehydrogenase family protein n=1 Tax=Bradyrhizobium sp. AS23.2 TaxID=1680155 RepID=UPI00093FB023|nr:acyl-CoA dehydrogenase family protein [Bradyrhizobium sp. AS23.2]OKO78290.1 hypothetical protein AC630_19530 [Bradyrhizobium sp. AS23.2]